MEGRREKERKEKGRAKLQRMESELVGTLGKEVFIAFFYTEKVVVCCGCCG